MNGIIPLGEVQRVRSAVEKAHEAAADNFRNEFEQSSLPREERFGIYMQMRADALLAGAKHVRLRSGRVQYDFEGRSVTPYVVRGEPMYSHFDVPRTPEAIFEYFVLAGEIFATPTWNLTRIIATDEEYDAALRNMKQPELVDVTVTTFLPQVETRDDLTAQLHVTVYTRAGEERIERRTLALDPWNEFAFHSRALIAEGEAGVLV